VVVDTAELELQQILQLKKDLLLELKIQVAVAVVLVTARPLVLQADQV
jgi:hypothetical protein